mgnify:CR=1 FL=1
MEYRFLHMRNRQTGREMVFRVAGKAAIKEAEEYVQFPSMYACRWVTREEAEGIMRQLGYSWKRDVTEVMPLW